MGSSHSRRPVRALLALAAAGLLSGCPSRPKLVAYDLARQTPVAERWSAREVVLFGTPGAEPYEAEGFYVDAPTGAGPSGFAWARREVELAFDWPHPAERALVLDLQPYAGARGQALEARLNGTRVAGFALNDGRHAYGLPLPASAQRAGDNRLRLVFAAAARPSDLDRSSKDDRELAAAFHTVTVGALGDPGLDDLLRREAPAPFAIEPQAQVPHLTLVGDAGVRYAVRLPAGAELRFTPELHAGAQAAAAQALFKVTFDDGVSPERELWSQALSPRDRRVPEVVVPLPGRAGSLARVGLHVVGLGDRRFAWGDFSAPRILGAEAPAGLVPGPLPAGENAKADRLRQALKGANVMLVIFDAGRSRSYSSYGYERATTPNVARLAAEGVQFENAFTPAVYTLAAMSSIWTSQYPGRHHGELAYSAPLPAGSFTLAGLLSAQTVTNVGFVANAMAGKTFGLGQGFEEFQEIYRELGSGAAGFRQRVPGWLEAHKDRRFFAYLHFREPHCPYEPPAPFDTRFGPAGPLPKEQAGDCQFIIDVNKGRHPLTADLRAEVERLYDGNLAYADAELGFLRGELERLGLLEKTVLIVAADHGEALGEHGYVGHNTQLYEHSLKVPLIVRFPAGAGPRGARVQAMVDLLDLAPTVADVFGLGAHADVRKHFQGRSLLPVVAGAPGKGAVLSRTVWDRPRYSLRDERFKFIYDTRSGAEELYDLEADPGERSNLAGRDGLRTAYYRQALHQWMSAVAPVRGTGAVNVGAPPDCETCQNLKSLGYLSPDTPCACP